jgi:hypothetical protein
MMQGRLGVIKLITLALAVCSTAAFYELRSTDQAALAGNQQPQAAASADTGNDKVKWFDNYEAGMKEARATGKPIFLEFRCAP